jgi:hypothetical protein
MANIAGQGRRSTPWKISFPTLSSLSKQPRRVELVQKRGKHDVLVMEFTTVSPLWFEVVKTGLPVEFTWKQKANTGNWVGYVSHVTKTVISQKENVMEVHCVGSTYPLKERATRVFQNTTIPEAIQTIGAEFGFNVISDVNTTRFAQLTMAGHSYWEWIQEQVQRIGFAVVIDGMTMTLRSIDNFIDQQITSTPLLSTDGSDFPTGAQFFDRTLDYFKVYSGENMEHSLVGLRAVKNIAGVDPLTSKAHLSSESPDVVGTNLRATTSSVLFNEYRSDSVANYSMESDGLAAGAAHTGRMNLPAKIKCQGDPRIRPWMPVYISGTGPITDGYWIVMESKHMFATIGDYQIEALVATDGTGNSVQTQFRPATGSLVGVLNLSEELKGNTSTPNTYTKSKVQLSVPETIVQEKSQGFTRTPSRWKIK